MARHSHDHGMQKHATGKATAPGTPSPAAPAATIPWGWQAALFIWAVSFAFLCLNEMLQVIFKVAPR